MQEQQPRAPEVFVWVQPVKESTEKLAQAPLQAIEMPKRREPLELQLPAQGEIAERTWLRPSLLPKKAAAQHHLERLEWVSVQQPSFLRCSEQVAEGLV